MAGEHLDISNDPSQPGQASSSRRRYLGVHFACCSVYSRVYVNRDETAYVGNCPRCSRQVRMKIGPGGTDQRFFTAY